MSRLPPRHDALEFDKTVQQTPGVWFVGALLIGGAFIGTILYFIARGLWALTACVA